jgi:DNA-binding Lrp family transcriptional regulator
LTTGHSIDEIDLKLLQMSQDEFPITKKPWAYFGDKLEISEDEVITRFKDLLQRKIIRKIGPILDAKNIGLSYSALIGIKISEDKIDDLANILNEYEAVTHNYVRDYSYNLWFTISTQDKKELEEIIEEIKQRTGITDEDVLILPTARKFKIDVRFKFT